MSESLRDQLLNSGLGKSVKAKSQSKKKPKPRTHSRPKPGSDLERAWAARRKSEKSEQVQKRAQKQAEQQRRQELNQKIFSLVDAGKISTQDGQIARNFLHHGKIRKIMLDQKQLKQLNNGELGVVFLRGRYFLLSRELTDKVTELSPYHVPTLDGVDDAQEVEHPVPDDLVW